MSDKRPLRILYSLNGSPQYILARSLSAVPVEFIPAQGNGRASSSRSTPPPPPRYASASLKTCLNIICRSSPELIQDNTRDFSVYLLDPLETDCAPAQVNIAHSLAQTEAPEARVAVGLGLMSWGLLADEREAMSVTGTLKVSAAGLEMLEIIFSFRETVAMQKAALPDALRSWGSSSLSKHKGQKPTTSKRKSRPAPPKPPPVPKAPPVPVTQSDKFLAAPIYIGPERRPAGRPAWRRTTRAEDGEVLVVDAPTIPPPSNLDPRGQQLLDMLAYCTAMSSSETDRNKALGNVLALVHGPGGTAGHPPPELTNAMTLFSQLPRVPPFPPPHSEGPPPFGQHRRKSSSTDDEIVVLNKENVNPTDFRRRAEREAKLLGSVETTGASASSSSGTLSHASSQATRLMPSTQSTNQPLTRKRTLSEFMEEQESVRDKDKAQKRYYRQPERSMSHDSLRPTSPAGASTNNDCHPPKSARTQTVSCTSSPGPSVVKKKSAVPVPPSKPLVSASSPIRPTRKRYIVPAWARTDTATQPRLSDRVVQNAQLKEDEENKKKKEVRSKHYLKERQDKGRLKDKPKPGAVLERRASEPPTNGSGSKLPLPLPVAASGEFPAFSQIPSNVPLTRFASQASSPSNLPPSTPPRKRRANTISTPGGPVVTPRGLSSLFTPASGSGSWETNAVLNLARRSLSPSSRKVPRQDINPPEPIEEPESDDANDLLGQELDSAFDELDFPPSSLPIASSDVEVDVGTEQMPSSTREYDSDDSDEDDVPPKQHWIGLPPSSPPPPSSPFLMGGSPTDDDDVEEAPLTASNAEVESEVETPHSPNTALVNSYSAEELSQFLHIDDLANFFHAAPADSIETANLFDQFTNYNHRDDSAQTMTDWGLVTPNPDFDFTEFWESVKPLVEGSSTSDENLDFGQSDLEAETVDNVRLAGDVHALFSGCLV
ncbi:hypothetical protein C8R43DRAFT_1074558 [Mycena crocata]|nr:hypothetical protein C8R43DRAFT_1074558 [Mycena crocata]